MFSHQGLAAQIWDDCVCFRIVLPSELRNMRFTPQSCRSDQKRAVSLFEHIRVVYVTFFGLAIFSNSFRSRETRACTIQIQRIIDSTDQLIRWFKKNKGGVCPLPSAKCHAGQPPTNIIGVVERRMQEQRKLQPQHSFIQQLMRCACIT